MVEATAHQEQVVGAHSGLKPCQDGSEEHVLFESQREALQVILDRTFDKFEVIGFTTQVVAGCIF